MLKYKNTIERSDNMEIETYRVLPEEHGHGTFFFTDCGNRMYSNRDEMAYHGCLCPKCFMKGKYVTLYIRGSKEANEYWKKKLAEE